MILCHCHSTIWDVAHSQQNHILSRSCHIMIASRPITSYVHITYSHHILVHIITYACIMSYIKSYHIFTHYVILNWRSDTQASTAFVPWCNVDRPMPRWAVRRTPRNRWRAKMAWLPWHCHVGSTLFEGWNCESFMNFCQCWCKRFLLESVWLRTLNFELNSIRKWLIVETYFGRRKVPGSQFVLVAFGLLIQPATWCQPRLAKMEKYIWKKGEPIYETKETCQSIGKICLGHQFVSTNAIMIASQDMMKLIELVYAFLHRWSLSTFSAWLQTQNTIIYPRITMLICCSKTEPEGLYE